MHILSTLSTRSIYSLVLSILPCSSYYFFPSSVCLVISFYALGMPLISLSLSLAHIHTHDDRYGTRGCAPAPKIMAITLMASTRYVSSPLSIHVTVTSRAIAPEPTSSYSLYVCIGFCTTLHITITTTPHYGYHYTTAATLQWLLLYSIHYSCIPGAVHQARGLFGW